MNVKVNIIWSNKSKQSLIDIMNYIKNRDSLAKAKYVKNEIIKTVENASLFPYKHPIEPIFNNTDVRFTVKWNFKIVFKINDKSLQVLEIFHTSRHPEKLYDADKE